MYRTDNWIDKKSSWIDETIKYQYKNILTYRPLSGSSCVKLPVELRNRKKGLISIKNNDQKCFLWCHVRHINPIKIDIQKKLSKKIKEWLMVLIMMELNFLCGKKILVKLKRKATFTSMFLVMKKINLSNLHFRSKIWKFNGFVTNNW